MPLELFIAWRYLKARRNGVFTFLTTLIAVGGITLGVAALIITLSVMSGFHRDIREKILGLQPHLIVLDSRATPIDNYGELQKKISSNKEISAAAPFVYGQIILRRGHSASGVALKGIDWEAENKLVGLSKLLTSGHKLSGNEIIVGNEIAANLGILPQDDVILMSPGQFGMIPKMEKFKVGGIFHSGMYEYDANLAYVSLDSAQRLFGMGKAVTGIGASLHNLDKTAVVEKQLQSELSRAFMVRSWQRLNSSLFAALKLEKIMMFIILGLIILVAAFNIISNLLLLTVEKSKEIGILSAMGFRRSEIGKIFFYEGLMIGSSGIALGATIGITIAVTLKKYQFIHLPADIYYLDTFPVRIIPGDIIAVLATALLITLAASVYPAYQASKLDPLDAVRYG